MRSEQTSKAVINVDLDGVVYDFDGALRNWLIGQGYDHDFPAPTQWDYWDDWDMTEGEWRMQFRRGVEAGYIWSKGLPVEGAIHGLWRLSDAGYFIRLVTSRLALPHGHKQAISATTEWLNTYGVPYSSIAFLGNETKANFFAEVLIDDNLGNCERFRPESLLVNKSYNQTLDLPAHVTRVEGWKDIVRFFGA